MKKKTISVAMATYNGARYLRKQLDSLYAQTRVPDEIVVCDDNSTDGTREILEEYKKSKGLRYFINEPALGVNKNFYRAISLCTSDYVAISDQDDIWLPEKIDITYQKLCEIDDGSVCVVSSLPNHIDAEDNIIKELPEEQDSYDYAATLLTILHSQGCSLMLNRALVDKVLSYIDRKEVDTIMYDAFISYTAAILGKKYNLGKRLMLYRHHETNVVSKAHSPKESVKEKTQRQWLLYRLIPNERIGIFHILNELYGNEVADPAIKSFLEQSEKLYQHNTLMGRINFIINRKELSFKKRMVIIIRSIGVSMAIKLTKIQI